MLADAKVFNAVKSLLQKHRYEEAIAEASLEIKLAEKIDGHFKIIEGEAFVDGELLPEALSKRLVQFYDAGLDFQPLLALWNRLRRNPSTQSRLALYGFLEENHSPITEDGCFIGYKYVDSNFKDSYTHFFDNRPGKVVSVPRNSVDPNPEHTCSTGLHVAAFDYANNNISNGHLILVKVDPENVVTVPPDYNMQKIRVCSYTVLEEYKEAEQLGDLIYNVSEHLVTKKVKSAIKSKKLVLSVAGDGRCRIPKGLLDQTHHSGQVFVYRYATAKLGIVASRPTAYLSGLSVEKNGTVRVSKTLMGTTKNSNVNIYGNTVVIG